jgi:hypothetical protein
MSGGKRIDDHSFWAGKGSKHSVFPEGVHCKEFDSAEGAGHMSEYEDTTEKIKSQQDMGIGKAKSLKQKHLYRN